MNAIVMSSAQAVAVRPPTDLGDIDVLAELREEIHILSAQVRTAMERGAPDVRFPEHWGLKEQQAKICRLLLAAPEVHKGVLFDAVYPHRHMPMAQLDEHIRQLTEKLKPFGVWVTQIGTGRLARVSIANPERALRQIALAH